MATTAAPKKATKKNALQAFRERNRKEPTMLDLKKEVRELKKYAKALEDELRKYDAK